MRAAYRPAAPAPIIPTGDYGTDLSDSICGPGMLGGSCIVPMAFLITSIAKAPRCEISIIRTSVVRATPSLFILVGCRTINLMVKQSVRRVQLCRAPANLKLNRAVERPGSFESGWTATLAYCSMFKARTSPAPIVMSSPLFPSPVLVSRYHLRCSHLRAESRDVLLPLRCRHESRNQVSDTMVAATSNSNFRGLQQH